jgi:hypothetical protein
MVRRRAAFDPLETAASPRWYVVRSMYGTVIESRLLPPGADLKYEFVTSILAWMNSGWKVGEFSSVTGTFFCDRHSERRMICIEFTDPRAAPKFGSGYFGGSP